MLERVRRRRPEIVDQPGIEREEKAADVPDRSARQERVVGHRVLD